MARRLDKTLADYIGIAISPVLIMVMVGSLVFFLMEVFYQGQYGERLHFILALFVMAIVLVARLSIELGSEHATIYGIPLAIVTALALIKFVDHGFLTNIGLMALIWWSAHKLTWDCTLIDETEDASGEGLLQSAGLEESPRHAGGLPQPPRKNVWQRVQERFSSKGPHAPGVWIVYFSLAALPLFAIGELFLPRSDPQRRAYAFRLLFFYVTSGLALLMTTSFLGLRRYLRQRSLQMPATMARSWLAIGCALVVVLVVLAALLPRPSADYDSSNIRLVFSSPDQEPSEHALLDGDGVEDEQGSGGAEGQQEPRQSGSTSSDERRQGSQAGKPGKSEGRKRSQMDDGRESQQESQSHAGQQGEKTGKQDRSPSRIKQRSPSTEKLAERQSQGVGKQPPAGSRPSNQDESGDRSQKQSGAKSHSEPGQNSDSHAPKQEQASDSQPEDRERTKPGEDQSDQPLPQAGENRPQREKQRPEDPDRRPSYEDEIEQPEEEKEQGGGKSSERSPSLPMPRLELGSGWWITLLRWLLYAVLAVVALLWAWRNRQMVIATVQGMVQALGDFWTWLFGRSNRNEETPAESAAVAITPPRPRFTTYDDPFVHGEAVRMPPDELVRYTFEAMEAWAHERGCERELDQTPHEFARAVAARAPQLGHGARKLAELYSQAAYAPGTLQASRVLPLKELWRDLRAVGDNLGPQSR